MDAENIADTHNRRANIELVSKRAKEYGFPYLAWPEDRFLLRLDDIPEILGRPNQPMTWSRMEKTRSFAYPLKGSLRMYIIPGFAYTRHTYLSIVTLTEYKVESR